MRRGLEGVGTGREVRMVCVVRVRNVGSGGAGASRHGPSVRVGLALHRLRESGWTVETLAGVDKSTWVGGGGAE